MNDNVNILGCFVSNTVDSEWSDDKRNFVFEQGKLFRTYLWSEKGIDNGLKKLKHEDYGKDLTMILFQFYINPIPQLLENLKEIENYKKKEKSIGIPIIVTDENFFNKSEEGKYKFLKETILKKMNVLSKVIEGKKLDTNIELLKQDIGKVLE